MRNPPKSRRRIRLLLLLVSATVSCVAGVLLYKHFLKPHRTIDGIEARNFATLEGALSQFQVDCGRFPTTDEGLKALMAAPDNTPNWHGPYLMHFPHDHWSRPYIYRCPSRKFPAGFLILSAGPDGIEGTEDDVSNESIQEIMEEREDNRFSVAWILPTRVLCFFEKPNTVKPSPASFVIYSFERRH